MSAHQTDQSELAERIRSGDRRALARAITLVESRRPDHRGQAEKLIDLVLPKTGKSIRLGISGPPGVGKSTFIEAFGMHLIDSGHKVAVLAIDPSSKISGGSILGDKTRMTELSRRKEAYIRPTPAGETVGGVARRTREAMLLCEAAGFDVVIVETVGIGQSETAVAEMTDMFLLLLAPGGGDDLQGVKRGVMELADLLIVNKADGDLAPAAERTAADYAHALRLMRPLHADWQPDVVKCSALKGEGMAAVWAKVAAFRKATGKSGEFDSRRRNQAKAWLAQEVTEGLLEKLRGDPDLAALLAKLEAKVANRKLSPGAAARQVLSSFFKGLRE
jgi:LAO/AO transport system kinase